MNEPKNKKCLAQSGNELLVQLIVAFVQMCRGVKKQREGEERNAQNLNGNGNISLQIAIFLPHKDHPL